MRNWRRFTFLNDHWTAAQLIEHPIHTVVADGFSIWLTSSNWMLPIHHFLAVILSIVFHFLKSDCPKIELFDGKMHIVRDSVWKWLRHAISVSTPKNHHPNLCSGFNLLPSHMGMVGPSVLPNCGAQELVGVSKCLRDCRVPISLYGDDIRGSGPRPRHGAGPLGSVWVSLRVPHEARRRARGFLQQDWILLRNPQPSRNLGQEIMSSSDRNCREREMSEMDGKVKWSDLSFCLWNALARLIRKWSAEPLGERKRWLRSPHPNSQSENRHHWTGDPRVVHISLAHEGIVENAPNEDWKLNCVLKPFPVNSDSFVNGNLSSPQTRVRKPRDLVFLIPPKICF
jgi:hypothetical protein